MNQKISLLVLIVALGAITYFVIFKNSPAPATSPATTNPSPQQPVVPNSGAVVFEVDTTNWKLYQHEKTTQIPFNFEFLHPSSWAVGTRSDLLFSFFTKQGYKAEFWVGQTAFTSATSLEEIRTIRLKALKEADKFKNTIQIIKIPVVLPSIMIGSEPGLEEAVMTIDQNKNKELTISFWSEQLLARRFSFYVRIHNLSDEDVNLSAGDPYKIFNEDIYTIRKVLSTLKFAN